MPKSFRFPLCKLMFILLFCCSKTFGQGVTPDSLELLTRKYQQLEPSQLLYVVTDKDVYLPGETLWLAAYLLDRWVAPDSLLPNILSIALRETGNPVPVMKTSFLINKGMSPGSWYLPDTLQPGHYELFCTTNLVGKDSALQHVFRVRIEIGLSRHQDIVADVKPGKESRVSKALVPLTDQKKADSFQVKFYPEGGDWIYGLESRMGWEVTSYGLPVAQRIVLFCNSLAIDTLTSNNNGMGMFRTKPMVRNIYYVRILNKDNILLPNIYSIPIPSTTGAVMELDQGVADSILSVRIGTSQQGMYKVALRHLITNEIALTDPFAIVGQKELKLDISSSSRGLIAITLLDALDRPVSERLFFANYHKTPQVQLQTNKDVYNVRDSVQVKFSINNDGMEGATSTVATVSCVQLSRVDDRQQDNIASYYYLSHWLGSDLGSMHQDARQLEMALLIKGWRRYRWNNNDWIEKQPLYIHRANLLGRVVRLDRRITRPLTVVTKRDATLGFFRTDNNGLFYPQPQDLVIPEGRTLFIKPEGVDLEDGYKAELRNPVLTLMESRMKKEGADFVHTLLPSNKNNEPIIINETFNGIKQLEAVVVKAKTNKPFITGGPGANECGDYVCSAGIINCMAHSPLDPGSRKPVKGQIYRIHPQLASMGKQDMIYTGCTLEGIKQEGVYTARDFYGMDSSMRANTGEPVYLSTLFWQPFVWIQNKRDNEFTFFTSDQAGEYLIRMLGITQSGSVFYTEKKLVIKKSN